MLVWFTRLAQLIRSVVETAFKKATAGTRTSFPCMLATGQATFVTHAGALARLPSHKDVFQTLSVRAIGRPQWLSPRHLTHCGRVTQICVFNTVKLGTSASSP